MLETELKFLSMHREELAKKYPGRFLVIRGEAITGVYESREAAMAGSAEMHGLVNVLIRRAEDVDEQAALPAYTFGLINACL